MHPPVVVGYTGLLSPASSQLQSTSFGQQKDRLMETNADTKRLQPPPPQSLTVNTANGNESPAANGEPIYAVVDLQNKYARRAKLQALEDQMQKERPKSFHVSSNDYEEVTLNFYFVSIWILLIL